MTDLTRYHIKATYATPRGFRAAWHFHMLATPDNVLTAASDIVRKRRRVAGKLDIVAMPATLPRIPRMP
jgi:hypothetical protein